MEKPIITGPEGDPLSDTPPPRKHPIKKLMCDDCHMELTNDPDTPPQIFICPGCGTEFGPEDYDERGYYEITERQQDIEIVRR